MNKKKLASIQYRLASIKKEMGIPRSVVSKEFEAATGIGYPEYRKQIEEKQANRKNAKLINNEERELLYCHQSKFKLIQKRLCLTQQGKEHPDWVRKLVCIKLFYTGENEFYASWSSFHSGCIMIYFPAKLGWSHWIQYL